MNIPLIPSILPLLTGACLLFTASSPIRAQQSLTDEIASLETEIEKCLRANEQSAQAIEKALAEHLRLGQKLAQIPSSQASNRENVRLKMNEALAAIRHEQNHVLQSDIVIGRCELALGRANRQLLMLAGRGGGKEHGAPRVTDIQFQGLKRVVVRQNGRLKVGEQEIFRVVFSNGQSQIVEGEPFFD